MSVKQKNKVDFIGINEEANEVRLGISDHLDWNEPELHYQLIQDKVNAYLAFIESGEILEVYPDSKGRKVAIELKAKFEPAAFTNGFFAKLEHVLSNAGYRFRIEVLGSG